MKNQQFVVQYINENNCFAYISDNYLRQLDCKTNVIKVRHKERYYYLSYRLRNGAVNNLYLNALFAKSLELNNGEKVLISIVDKDVPEVSSVFVSPKTEHDREIIELHFEKVQSTLLNQINIVAVKQPLIVWVSKFYPATLLIESLDRDLTFGRMIEDTEVHISYASNSNATEQSKQITPTKTSEIMSESWMKHKAPVVEIFRAILFQKSDEANFLYHVYHVFTRKSKLSTHFLNEVKNCSNVFCKISKLKENVDEKIKDNSRTDHFYVKLFFIDDINNCDIEDPSVKEIFKTIGTMNHLFISQELGLNLNLHCGGKIMLEISSEIFVDNITSLEVYPVVGEIKKENVLEYVKKRSVDNLLLLNSENYLKMDNGSICNVRILPISCPYGLFDVERLTRIQINVHEKISKLDGLKGKLNCEIKNDELKNISLSGINDIITKCMDSIILTIKSQTFSNMQQTNDNVLICGSAGSGKTTICKILQRKLNTSYFIHSNLLNCVLLKGKKAEIIQKMLMNILSECVYYQQSVLILDNLDCITNPKAKQEENNMDSLNADRIADIIYELITETRCLHNISIIATCLDHNLIGDKLRVFQGNYFFGTVLTIPALEKINRIQIIKNFCESKANVSEDINWDYFASISHGWVYQDLKVVTEKAAFLSWKRHVKETKKHGLCIEERDLNDALKDFVPINLHDIKLCKNEGSNWTNIGGLKNVKATLTELLHWPLKYHNLFKNAPIKQQSGILLYGMPGTGKTMIASSIAKEFDLNLISVKGPELLSKYIGASEEAVRNVFNKAQAAKPCVLFFDEFDSLAPRRGHDNTGVTDRVVNQLLTQLDGVEGREGVAVIAATSRPDLIDPALLRPGRLDKILLCPLPDKTDREETLLILSELSQIKISTDELNELLDMTEGFTGADLHVLIKQAKLNVMEQAVNYKSQVNSLLITVKDIFDAAKIVKPSISSSERQKFLNVYQRFNNHQSIYENLEGKERVTLA